MLGCGCSPATIAMAEISPYHNLPMVHPRTPVFECLCMCLGHNYAEKTQAVRVYMSLKMCSVASILSALYMQISYASSADALSDRQQFRSFFRTESPESIISPGFASFVQHFGWKQIGIISQQETIFLNVNSSACMPVTQHMNVCVMYLWNVHYSINLRLSSRLLFHSPPTTLLTSLPLNPSVSPTPSSPSLLPFISPSLPPSLSLSDSEGNTKIAH